MTTIPAGYRLAVLDEQGTVLETVDVGGCNLGHPVERAQLAGVVESAVYRAQVSLA